jgi:hypothetical protein
MRTLLPSREAEARTTATINELADFAAARLQGIDVIELVAAVSGRGYSAIMILGTHEQIGILVRAVGIPAAREQLHALA